jgi:predicted DNA-binding transcriptional regulator YafY
VRASRLVSLLLLLQTRGQLTAPELAEELEVSVRTVYRDVEALSAAGVPIYAEAGRSGGFRLVEGYRTRLTGLSAKEAEALLLGGTPGPVGELGLGTVFAAAQAKLLAALPKDVADRAFLVRQRFHLDAAGWFRSSRVPAHLGPVATAVWEGRKVEIVYSHFDSDDDARRVLDPLGLVLKAGVWYLVGTRDGETRTYRVSRIKSARALTEEAVRPPEFDLARYWADAVARFEVGTPRLTVTLRGTARAIGVLRQRGCDPAPLGPQDHKGTAQATVVFDEMDSAVRELMPLGGALEVIDPPDLRQRLHDAARDVLAVYGDGVPGR